jgi:hypothetical protein
MDSRRACRLLGIAILLISVVLLAWGVWPNGTLSRSVVVPPDEQNTRRLVLTQPVSVRRGDLATVHLRLEVVEASPAEPLLSVADDHNILVEARLELPGLSVRPAEAINQPLRPNQGLSFSWRFNPDRSGHYSGTAWLHLRFIHLIDGSEFQQDGEIRRAVFAGPVEVQVVDLFGLGGLPARWLGGTGMIAGALLSLDGLIARGLAYLRLKRRLKAPRSNQETEV